MIRLEKVRGVLALLVVLGFAATAAAEEAKGTIKSIFADKNEIVLKGVVKDTTYDVKKDARFWIDGKEVKLADLKENDKVAIEYMKDGERNHASEVRCLRKAQETT